MIRADRRRFALAMLGVWLLACAIMLGVNWHEIAALQYPDADDQLRLLEVHDFIAGQSWFDVTQYRMNPPAGAPMHWSRIIDLPIAAVIAPLSSLIGYPAAQTVGAVVVPLVTLGVVMTLIALVGRRLLGLELGLLCGALAATSSAALQQLRPLRVDHHGWQIAFALAALLALFEERPKRSGAAAGAMLALWMQVSLEGLPFCVGLAGIVALRWAVKGGADEAARLRAFGLALAGTSLALFGAMHAPGQWRAVYCDAVSPPHLAVFLIAAAGVSVATLPAIARSLATRFAALAALGLACAAAYHLVAPVCGLNAFAQLEPLVYKIWYSNVLEGQPLWRQSSGVVAGAIGFPIVGLAGSLYGWRHCDQARRRAWASYVMALAVACVTTVFVQRGGAVANVLAIPGAVAVMARLLRTTQASASPAVRVIGSAAAVVALCPLAPALLWAAVAPREKDDVPASAATAGCGTTADFRRLDALPPSPILAALDITPGLLLNTRHTAVASSHHRNHVAMNDVITAFTGSARQAHAIIARRRIRYVLVCPDEVELQVYEHYAPKGFWAELKHGRAYGWLQPVRVPGAKARIWRVTG